MNTKRMDWTQHYVAIVDDDLDTHMTAPGRYRVMDLAEGVIREVVVGADGSKETVATTPLAPSPTSGRAVTTCGKFELIEIAVGRPFPYGTLPGQVEGNQVMITPGGILVMMYLDGPTPREIRQVQDGRFSMRLLRADHTMMFLFRFGDMPWQDSPYSVHRVPSEFRECPPDPGEGYGWLLNAVVIDAKTGIVSHIRRLSLSRRFSCAVLAAFEDQQARSRDDIAHQREVAWMQRRSPASLAERAVDRFEQGDTKN